MPLGAEEYRIAQLYMIAKKSQLESEGHGNGVEIVTNEPYSDGPGGSGQYTDKLYHISAHLPAWMRGFLPKALSTVREEAWNAYPYSKNKIYTPYTEKFKLEIESKYLVGGTNQDNVFELDEAQLKSRSVDVINFVTEEMTGPYNEDEDPIKYVSKKTSRGPLASDWLEQYESISNNHDSKDTFMCIYKICKVQFDQWPIGGRVEQFIQDYIRKTLISAHRQAWVWQDEWLGLSIEQIREMEKDIQESLAKTMRKASGQSEN